MNGRGERIAGLKVVLSSGGNRCCSGMPAIIAPPAAKAED